MGLTKQEKIKEQLIRYDLIKRIEHVEIWISTLTEIAVENLISLNIELSEFLIKDNSVLLYLLKSKHYLDDIEYIKNAKTEAIFDCLVRFAEHMSIIKEGNYPGKEEYYEKDRKLLANAKSDEMAKSLLLVALDFASLKSGHHEKDMELIMQSEKLIDNLKESGKNTTQIVYQILNSNYNEKNISIKEEIPISNARIYESEYVIGNTEEELPEDVSVLERKI